MVAFAVGVESELNSELVCTCAHARIQLASFCLSEPASGSDAFALQTRAKKDGDHWVINGSKMWITNSYEAEIFLIFANVNLFWIPTLHFWLKEAIGRPKQRLQGYYLLYRNERYGRANSQEGREAWNQSVIDMHT